MPNQGSKSQSAIDSKATVERLVRSNADQARLIRTLTQLTELAAFPPYIIASQVMLDLIVAIDLARNSRAPVLIMGETGTGKELIARAVHLLSNRRERKFIAFNCAEATNPGMIASELFGHQRGSFTGAVHDSKGIIRAAEGGTLLLDEIGELPLEVQPHLLRFLQEGEVRPVGATRPVKTDVCVIAATNRDLEVEVRAGRFRVDLFERLNTQRLHIPPLRERREEIPHLIAHFLKHYQQEEHRQGLRLNGEVMELLCNYDWPRNVRQLEHEVHRLVLKGRDNEVIGLERLTPEIRANADVRTIPPAEIVEDCIRISLSLPYPERQGELQRLSIITALTETNGNLNQAAAIMRMSRNGLKKMIKRFGIEVEKYRQS